MEEKILIQAKFGRFNIWSMCAFIFTGLLLLICFIVATEAGGSPSWAFEGIEYGYYGFFIGAGFFLLAGWIMMELNKKSEFLVSSSKVVGKTLFGKRVDLPISQVSSVGTGILKRVSVATSSGIISFYGVENQTKVFQCISDLLIKRQEDTIVKPTKSSESTDISEQLKKIKELFDNGIITQEEFELKKKQILGL